MANRPRTIREIQNKKKSEDPKIRIINTSTQLISIHMKAPKGIDFYFGNQDIHLPPQKHYDFPSSRLMTSQLDRLQKRGMIKISAAK